MHSPEHLFSHINMKEYFVYISSLSNFLIHEDPKSLPWETLTVNNLRECFSVAFIYGLTINPQNIQWMQCNKFQDQWDKPPFFCMVTFTF